MREPLVDVHQVSLLAALNVLVGQWRVLVGLPVLLGTGAVVVGIMAGGDYRARSRFAPQSQQAAATQVAGLAAQFGISLGASAGSSASPDFYADLIRTRDLLKQAAVSLYRLDGDRSGRTLVDIWKVRGSAPETRVERAIERLQQSVTVSVSLKTGVVTLETRDRSRDLALQLNRRLLELLAQFDVERRQSQAAAERRFVEGRFREAQQALQRAEDQLASFLERNRRYQDSPQLTFQAARLQRQVDLQQQVYSSLAQAYERARIDEVRNTPVLTVVDSPDALPARRGLVRKALVGLFLGGAFGLVLALAREYWAREQERHPEEVWRFRSRLEEIRSIFLRPLRRVPGGSSGLPSRGMP